MSLSLPQSLSCTAPLPSQEGAVWLGAVRCSSISTDQADAYRELLSDRELERNWRYRRASDRHRDIITRALLRTVLGEQLKISPQEVDIVSDDNGKLHLSARQLSPDAGLQFNLSHAGDWVVFVMARCRIGIDIEKTVRKNNVLAIAKRYFSPAEQCALTDFHGNRRERFFSYWTLKEAYFKARGEGVSRGLSRASFSFVDYPSIAMTAAPCLEENPLQWRFISVAPQPNYCLALAINSPLSPQFFCEEWQPLLARRPLLWKLI